MQQMKQEFLSARFMLYQGLQNYGASHFSDETMQHVNTLDYPINGFFVEMIKTAFKTSYSILDKVGTFINEYFKLDINERNLSFRNVWYAPYKKNRPKTLRECFDGRQNLPLRGLYWLSKDLMNSPTTADPPEEYLELEAEAILKLRNRLEHVCRRRRRSRQNARRRGGQPAATARAARRRQRARRPDRGHPRPFGRPAPRAEGGAPWGMLEQEKIC